MILVQMVLGQMSLDLLNLLDLLSLLGLSYLLGLMGQLGLLDLLGLLRLLGLSYLLGLLGLLSLLGLLGQQRAAQLAQAMGQRCAAQSQQEKNLNRVDWGRLAPKRAAQLVQSTPLVRWVPLPSPGCSEWVQSHSCFLRTVEIQTRTRMQ